MRRIFTLIAAGALSVTAAAAQTTPPASPATPAPVPAPVAPPAPAVQPAPAAAEKPPLPGANSFTQSQAQSRIEAAGYTAVTGLKKDDQGIWRCTATKDGKSVSVSLDYKGNVTEG